MRWQDGADVDAVAGRAARHVQAGGVRWLRKWRRFASHQRCHAAGPRYISRGARSGLRRNHGRLTVCPALLSGNATVTLTASQAGATIQVNGVATPSGDASRPLPLPSGCTSVSVLVAALDGVTQVVNCVVVFTGALSSQHAYVKTSSPDPGEWGGFSVAADGPTPAIAAIAKDGGRTGQSGTVPTTGGPCLARPSPSTERRSAASTPPPFVWRSACDRPRLRFA